MTHKFNRITAGAAILAVAIGGMTACAPNQQTRAKELEGNTVTAEVAPVVSNDEATISPSPEPTPEKVYTYVVISATMSNRAYTDATMHPYRFQPGDTNQGFDNGRLIEHYHGLVAPPEGEAHTRYEVTVTYTLRGADGEIITKTVPRDKIRVVAVDSDYTSATGTKEQVEKGELTFAVPLNATSTRDGNVVNLREVAN